MRQEKFQERPALSYGLLYPRSNGLSDNVPKKSYKNVVHDGKPGERVTKCLPYKDNVQFGTDDTTTDANGSNQVIINNTYNSDRDLLDSALLI